MDSIKIKFKIGEFSKLCLVTVKTLRLYEEMGLLKPFEIDEWTGYRYYDVSQLSVMNRIHDFKSLGFTLEEIKNLLEDGYEFPPTEMIDEKLFNCETELKKLTQRRDKLLSLKFHLKNEVIMDNIKICKLPAIIVASYRSIIKSYDDLFNLCPNVIGPEMEKLGCKCPEPGYCYTINHSHEYNDTNIDIEYCEQVTEKLKDSELIKFKEVPEVEKALCYKHYGSYDKFPEAWEKLYDYIEKQGYRISGEVRFNFIDGIWNKESEDEWLSEIQVPVVTC